ncbi:MAG TPA: site-2 protease family protein [Candidatus Polarisedimenticolia bacterium]|jgi:Zn-dependent protease
MDNFTPAKLAEFGVWFIVFLFSSTLHEAGHALLARMGGDDTAYLGGQVSLNPMPHIRREPFGMILVPVITFFMMGWMMGWASTPYDPRWAQRYPGRQALMSAAGPIANLIIAAAAFGALAALLSSGVFVSPEPDQLTFSSLAQPASRFAPGSILHPLAAVLSVGLSLNLLLFIFNLLPLPPLDGSGVLHGLFPDSVGRVIEMLSRNPMMSLLGLVLAWQVFPQVFMPAFALVLWLLHPGIYAG